LSSLYEKKLVTHVLEVKYISEDVGRNEVDKNMEAMEKFKVAVAKMYRLNKRTVNDLKVTDHHGILITDKIPSALSA
jgi:DNA topoisomerase-3